MMVFLFIFRNTAILQFEVPVRKLRPKGGEIGDGWRAQIEVQPPWPKWPRRHALSFYLFTLVCLFMLLHLIIIRTIIKQTHTREYIYAFCMGNGFRTRSFLTHPPLYTHILWSIYEVQSTGQTSIHLMHMYTLTCMCLFMPCCGVSLVGRRAKVRSVLNEVEPGVSGSTHGNQARPPCKPWPITTAPYPPPSRPQKVQVDPCRGYRVAVRTAHGSREGESQETGTTGPHRSTRGHPNGGKQGSTRPDYERVDPGLASSCAAGAQQQEFVAYRMLTTISGFTSH